jgi:hypothetical protein
MVVGKLMGVVIEARFGFAVGIIGGAIAGIMQWLVLRQHVSQASWWVLASTVGWAVGGAVGGDVGGAAVGAGNLAIIADRAMSGAPVGALGGAVAGSITGIALVWLFQHPTPIAVETFPRYE